MKHCFLLLSISALLTGCVGETDPSLTDPTRMPLGKTDISGSCSAGDFCGGPSDGSCWCDDFCETIGDCCEDKVQACDADDSCVDGTITTETVFSNGASDKACSTTVNHCITDDGGACPQLSPVSPDFCSDGNVVPGSPSYIPSADGKECSLPSIHCLTTDFDACPQLSPLPQDYCSDGELVSDGFSFVPSTDGKECAIPRVICVATDDTCEDNCEGTIVTSTSYSDSTDDKQCANETDHCLTDDAFACPQIALIPPSFCPDGDVVAGPDSYVSSADGLECALPSAYCITRDSSACPQLSPLPPNFCSDGTVVQGEPSFIASADGMHCEMPSVHCVSNDAAACGL